MAKMVCNFISRVLQRTVDITVVIPSITIPESLAYTGGLKHKKVHFDLPKYPRYVDRPKYPVLYLFHGMGNNHATWTGYTNAEFYAEERNLALVMISGENKSYVNHPNGDKFYDFIEDELFDFVCGMFPVSRRPEDTYLAGLSMGGYGTLVHALNHPEKFGAVGVLSSAIDYNPFQLMSDKEQPAPEEYSPLKLVEKIKREKTPMPPFYFACGENDDLIEPNRAFMKQLEEIGVKTTWHQLPGYEHEWRFWNREVELLMDWLPRTDDYARQGKRRI